MITIYYPLSPLFLKLQQSVDVEKWKEINYNKSNYIMLKIQRKEITMHKSILIFKNITDFTDFEQYIKEKLIPFILDMEGISGIQLTTLIPLDDPEAARSKKFQYLLEAYFKRMENLEVLIKNRKGITFLRELSNNPNFDVTIFMGNEKNISPDK